MEYEIYMAEKANHKKLASSLFLLFGFIYVGLFNVINKSEVAMVHDTLKLLSATIENNNLINLQELRSTAVSCQTQAKWKFGSTFKTYLSGTSLTGLTGRISFDTRTGKRNNTFLYIVDLVKNGVDLVSYFKNKFSLTFFLLFDDLI
jgi:hypothetical protein